jgi:hypothetical protein
VQVQVQLQPRRQELRQKTPEQQQQVQARPQYKVTELKLSLDCQEKHIVFFARSFLGYRPLPYSRIHHHLSNLDLYFLLAEEFSYYLYYLYCLLVVVLILINLQPFLFSPF